MGKKHAAISLDILNRKVIKYLGIYIDQNLSNWHQEISHVYNKIVKNMGIVKIVPE